MNPNDFAPNDFAPNDFTPNDVQLVCKRLSNLTTCSEEFFQPETPSFSSPTPSLTSSSATTKSQNWSRIRYPEIMNKDVVFSTDDVTVVPIFPDVTLVPVLPDVTVVPVLPDVVMMILFEMLDPLSLIRAAGTCRRWNQLITGSKWLQRLKRRELKIEDDVWLQDVDDDDDMDSMSVDADSNDEEDCPIIPSRLQRLASIQKWVEGAWVSTKKTKLEDDLPHLPTFTHDFPRNETSFNFTHPLPLSHDEWGRILDCQLSR